MKVLKEAEDQSMEETLPLFPTEVFQHGKGFGVSPSPTGDGLVSLAGH